MSAPGFTPISLYHSTTAAATPSAGNLAAGELAVNITDGKLFYKDNGGVVRVLATAAGSAGDVVGPGSSTDNALVRFDGTTGKLVQNSAGVLDDSGNLTGIAALTTSGALTLNGGTANGVAYLNGSKVLTTGSALTFDGTNLGVGFTANSRGGVVMTTNNNSGASEQGGYQVTNGNGTGLFSGVNGASYSTGGIGNANNAVLYTIGNTDLVFGRDTSEQMRLTSTGLGIGTSSPAQRLDVRGGSIVVDTASAGLNPTVFFDHDNFASGTRNYIQMNRGTEAMLFGVANADRMTLSASGNLGLGVTPSAWGGVLGSAMYETRNAMHFGSINSTSSIGYIGVNAYYDGTNWVYKNSSQESCRYELNSNSTGAHAWFTAPSGTAGNAISFTQAMTLDASGRLGVGVTSPAAPIDVQADSGALGLQIRGRAASNLGYITFRNNANTANLGVIGSGDGGITFDYGGTERARIDSSGNLLVGKTATDLTTVGWHLNPSASGVSSQVATISTGTNEVFVYNNTSTGGNARVDFRTANVSKGNIQWNNSNTAYNTTSDYRLKEDIALMTGALAKVAALKPCTYRWKADGSDGEGFIAHELQAVVPQCVTGEKDAVDAEGNPQYQGIDTSFLVATLTAAIQEQQAIITALTARVAALESN